MKKKQLLSAIVLSTIALSQSGLASADELTPVDPTSPSTTEVVTPVESSTPTEVIATDPVDATTDQTTPVDPTTPSTEVVPPTTEQETEGSEDGADNPVSTQPDSIQPSEEKENSVDSVNVPVEQPQTTTQATQQGTSQVGTISTSTGQLVQNVTVDAPVQTNTGFSIVSTQNGQVVLSDGSTVSPEAIGAVTNADKTITVTKADGKKATLPQTGDEKTGLLTVLGVALIGMATFFKKKNVG